MDKNLEQAVRSSLEKIRVSNELPAQRLSEITDRFVAKHGHDTFKGLLRSALATNEASQIEEHNPIRQTGPLGDI